MAVYYLTHIRDTIREKLILGEVMKRYIALASVLFAATGIDFAETGGPSGAAPDVVVDEQELSNLAQELRSPDANHRAAARDRLAEIGKPAVRTLLDAVTDDSDQTRQCAIAALSTIGPATDEVVPALVHALGDDSYPVRWGAHTALRTFGASVLPELLESFDSVESIKHRQHIVELIGEYRADALDAVPQLVAILSAPIDKPSNEDYYFRAACAEALGKIGPMHESVIPTLIDALESRYPNVREAAARGLWNIGPPARDAVPALLATLDKNSSSSTAAAVNALCAIGVDPEIAVPKFIPLLENSMIVSEVAKNIGSFGRAAAPAIPHLAALIDESQESQAGWAILRALGEIGPDSLPTLTQLLDSESVWTCAAAAQAVGIIGPEASSAIPKLEALLEISEDRLRYEALRGLAGIGEPAFNALRRALRSEIGHSAAECLVAGGSAVVPLLEETVMDSTLPDTVRLRATFTLRELKEPAVPALARLLDTEDVVQTKNVTLVLLQLGPVAESAVPALLNVAQHHPNKESRRNAINALCHIDSRDDRVIDLSLDALIETDEKLRSQAVSTARYLGPQIIPAAHDKMKTLSADNRAGIEQLLATFGEAVKPTVSELSTSEDPLNRVSAARILAAMPEDAEYRAKRLQALLGDSSESVRAAAFEGLGPLAAEVSLSAAQLLPFLFDTRASICEPAGVLIGRIRPVEREVLVAVAAALERPEVPIRMAAAAAAQELGNEAHGLGPALANAFETEEEDVRVAIARALAAVGPEGGPAAPHLISLLRAPVTFRNVDALNADNERRENYWRALLAVAPGSPEAVEYLANVLADKEYMGMLITEEYSIITALAESGPDGISPIIEFLERDVWSGSPTSGSTHALEMLGKHGGAEAIPILKRIFLDESVNRNLRFQAGRALTEVLKLDELTETDLLDSATKEALETAFFRESVMSQIGCELTREEIASDREGMQHFQYRLTFNDGGPSIPLGRQYAAFEEGPYSQYGFDPDSFGVGWLREPDLVQCGWSTFSVGSGHYTADTVVLLLKVDETWKEIFRHTGEGRSRGGWMSSHHMGTGFRYEEGQGLLLVRTYSGHECLENPVPLGRPFENNDGRTYYTFDYTETWEWPCVIENGSVTIQPGKRWIDLQNYRFPLTEVARWRTGLGLDESPENRDISDTVEANLDILRQLNPEVAESEEVTGGMLIQVGCPPFEPYDGHLYSTAEG